MAQPVQVPTIPSASFRLPPQLEGLRRLAYNLYWSWHPRAKYLFNRIDSTSWTRYRNPIPVLTSGPAWTQLLDDPSFMAEYEDVLADFDRYMTDGSDHWFSRRPGPSLTGPIAYFCAEYGFYESLGIYSGGLGVLAGDHTKTASDMALPFIGVGLLYRKGYFRQTIDADGHQEHAYPDYDLSRLPLSRVVGEDGEPLHVSVELPDRELSVAVWCAQVGGVRAIRALRISPAVWHLNEGHSAFLLAERARELVTDGSSLVDAWDEVRRNSVFTIHTPVPAGNERFDVNLVRRVAGPLLEGDGRPGTGGVRMDELLRLRVGGDGG